MQYKGVKQMDKTELLAKLNQLKDRKFVYGNYETIDCESNHIDADNLLLEYINDKEITNAFNQICKWYS